MAEPNGASGAVAALLDQAKSSLPSEAEQLDLLAAQQRPAGSRLHVSSPSGRKRHYDEGLLAQEIERTAKAGRPKGAQNLATRELKSWIVHLLGGSPQERLARWVMLEPEELARRLNCSVSDAFDRQIKILQELAPYIMARQAPVDDAGKPVPFVNLTIGGAGAVAGVEPWLRAFQPLEGDEPIDITPAREGEP